MFSVEDRIYEIEQKYAHLAHDFFVLSMTNETFRLVLALNDGTTLRVAERWRGEILARYSYYWLDSANELKVGWDNSPHHKRLENFPHHKHIGEQGRREPSYETSLDDVMAIVEKEMKRHRN